MAEWKQLSAEEASQKKSEAYVLKAAENNEVEGQGFVACPACGFMGFVEGTPLFVYCEICGNVFAVVW